MLLVPAGLWAQSTLLDWRDHVDEIGRMIDAMIRAWIDTFRPVLEYQGSSGELRLHMWVTPMAGSQGGADGQRHTFNDG